VVLTNTILVILKNNKVIQF